MKSLGVRIEIMLHLCMLAWGILPYKGLIWGHAVPLGYHFWGFFVLNPGYQFYYFVLSSVSFLGKCLKQRMVLG